MSSYSEGGKMTSFLEPSDQENIKKDEVSGQFRIL
jgi:hypothetical protein